MNETHTAEIAALERLCFSDPWSVGSIAEELENPLSCWIVAEDESGSVLGYAGSQTVMDEADVMNVAVSPDARRQGTGSMLMISLMNMLFQRGVRLLTLEVRASNEGAVSMYHKLGFIQVGRRPCYYRHPREDALILRAELPGSPFVEKVNN